MPEKQNPHAEAVDREIRLLGREVVLAISQGVSNPMGALDPVGLQAKVLDEVTTAAKEFFIDHPEAFGRVRKVWLIFDDRPTYSLRELFDSVCPRTDEKGE